MVAAVMLDRVSSKADRRAIDTEEHLEYHQPDTQPGLTILYNSTLIKIAIH